ncbi:MAG: hypothetical protein J6I45_08400 [Clostridia bacterium]|nr:hypothetical protein [Clostridia bacterium]
MKRMRYYLNIFILIIVVLCSCDQNVINDINKNDLINENFDQKTAFEFTPSDDRAAEAQNVVTRNFGSVRYHDGYVYIFSSGQAFRFNPETGNITNLCSDPICLHETDECPFYGIRTNQQIHINDGKIYFLSQRYHRSEEGNRIFEYYRMQYDINLQTAKVLEVYPFSGSWTGSDYYSNEWRYYIKIDTTEEKETYENLLRRENLNTGKTEILMNLGDINYTLVYVNEERIYLHDGVNLFYYILDDLNNKCIISDKCKGYIACDGEWFYHTLIDGDKTSLVKYDMEGGNRVTLAENISRSYSTEQYIYYMPDVMYTIGEDITNYKSDIYRVPKNGGTAELVYTFPEDMIDRYVILYFIVDGNYLYANYGVYTSESDNWYESINADPYDVMRINLSTGDIYYISK